MTFYQTLLTHLVAIVVAVDVAFLGALTYSLARRQQYFNSKKKSSTQAESTR